MRTFILFLGIVFASQAQANSISTAFSPDTVLPVELQARVLDRVLSGCTGLNLGSLSEESTTLETIAIDQGQENYQFTTTFTASANAADRTLFVRITVVSMKAGFTNPGFDNLSVEAPSDNSAGLCR